jgi:hypothetical protein
MAVWPFNACHSILRLFIDRNTNFQRFAIFLVRGTFIKPFPDLDGSSESGRLIHGLVVKERSCEPWVLSGRRIDQAKPTKRMSTPLGGIELPTFRLTAERVSQLRHRGLLICQLQMNAMGGVLTQFQKVPFR